MGELIGLPEWLAKPLFVFLFLMAFYAVAWLMMAKQHTRVARSRPNPTKEQFIADMRSSGVYSDAAEFLWKLTLEMVEPKLTPHPDDLLGDDLLIDEEEWGLDWPRYWAEQQGFHESNLPDWPEGWPPTVRNFGRWLSMPLD